MIPISNALLTSRRNRPFLRDPQKYRIYNLKGVIVHWTANTGAGANAWANRNYFNTTDRYASAHYMVDDNHILQCLPDYEVGYHVGARTYKPIGKSLMEGDKNPNYFVIGIEMCVNSDGDWDKTYQNTVDLTQYLLNLHNFSIHQLWRHYDITGKDCPKMMIDEAPWQAFRKDVNEGLKLNLRDTIKKGVIRVDDYLNVRDGNGTSYGVV
ncbi:MAG: N-acetylmuramoyl-L-alanine amidase, partial [Bacteroidota bacterium]